MEKSEILAITTKISTDLNLDPNILPAFITIESAWDPYAMRYEDFYPYTVEPEKFAKQSRISAATESKLQKFSYGLMQLMGGTARDVGFDGPMMKLIEVETNVLWGAKFVQKLQRRYLAVEDLAAAYNAGSARKGRDGKYFNQSYVDKFLAAYKAI